VSLNTEFVCGLVALDVAILLKGILAEDGNELLTDSP
jgi:hypothetical protein